MVGYCQCDSFTPKLRLKENACPKQEHRYVRSNLHFCFESNFDSFSEEDSAKTFSATVGVSVSEAGGSSPSAVATVACTGGLRTGSFG